MEMSSFPLPVQCEVSEFRENCHFPSLSTIPLLLLEVQSQEGAEHDFHYRVPSLWGDRRRERFHGTSQTLQVIGYITENNYRTTQEKPVSSAFGKGKKGFGTVSLELIYSQEAAVNRSLGRGLDHACGDGFSKQTALPLFPPYISALVSLQFFYHCFLSRRLFICLSAVTPKAWVWNPD